MIRKLFIVAKGNSVAYRSLQNTVGLEPDVAIIYDRRSRVSEPDTTERRQASEIDEEVAAQGWAVFHNEAVEPLRESAMATTRYNKLREIWGMPKAKAQSPDR